MGEFSSDDHYIYYCGPESLRRDGVVFRVNTRVQNALLKCNLKNNRIICLFSWQTIQHHSNHKKNWKILKQMRIPDHLTCLLRNLYAGQEATVRTRHKTTDWFQIGKGVRQGCILSSCLFNLCAEYILQNAGLDEAQAGIKIDGRNINKLRYADDTTLTAESEEAKKPLDESERGE